MREFLALRIFWALGSLRRVFGFRKHCPRCGSVVTRYRQHYRESVNGSRMVRHVTKGTLCGCDRRAKLPALAAVPVQMEAK